MHITHNSVDVDCCGVDGEWLSELNKKKSNSVWLDNH